MQRETKQMNSFFGGKRALTLVETLVALGIIAILSGIVYSVAQPAREKGKETACASQLRQQYIKLHTYASDWDGGQYPELHGLTYIPSQASFELYEQSPEVHWCPSAPVSLKTHPTVNLSYLNGIAIQTEADLLPTSWFRGVKIKAEKRLGHAPPIISCSVHDELFIAPTEKHIDTSLQRPTYLSLCADGVVRKVKMDHPRDFPVTGRK
jgi:prepilin-type N-terminal cleavage/methylation domain-containing protein